jgi:hypothetical protein
MNGRRIAKERGDRRRGVLPSGRPACLLSGSCSWIRCCGAGRKGPWGRGRLALLFSTHQDCADRNVYRNRGADGRRLSRRVPGGMRRSTGWQAMREKKEGGGKRVLSVSLPPF